MAKHNDRKSVLLRFSDNRASNTLRLRKKYQDKKIENIGTGKKLPPFGEWAKKNFPNVRIVGG